MSVPQYRPPMDHIIAAGWIVNNAAFTTHTVNTSLDDLSSVLSTNRTGRPEIDEALGLVEDDLDSISLTQADEGEKIRSQLNSVLDGEVPEHLEREIEKQVEECIDRIVAQLVEACIGEYVPMSLRNGIDRQRQQLDSIRIQLYNMEARRHNGTIQTPKHLHEPLRPLLIEDGTKCKFSPESVSQLLELSIGEILELVGFYGGSDPGKKSRSENVNWFLKFSGVVFQYVHG